MRRERYTTGGGVPVSGVYWKYAHWPDKRGRQMWIVFDRAPGEGGKRRQKWERVESGKIKDATARRAKRLEEVSGGLYTEASEQRLADVVAAYLKTFKGRNAGTHDCYRRWLQHVLDYFGDVGIADVSHVQIEQFYGSLACGRTHATHIVKRLKAVMKFALRHDIITRDPFLKVELPRVTREQRKKAGEQQQEPLSPSEVARLFKHLDEGENPDTESLMWQTLWHVEIDGGFRMGELRGLKWERLHEDSYDVQEQLLRDGTYGPPKDDSYGSVRLSAGTIDSLRRWQAAQRLAYGVPFEGLIFARVLTPLHFNQVSRQWKRLLEGAGLRHRRFHDCRHTCASLIANAPGGSLLQIKEQLRHSDLTTTMDTYSHLFPENRTSGLDALAGIEASKAMRAS